MFLSFRAGILSLVKFGKQNFSSSLVVYVIETSKLNVNTSGKKKYICEQKKSIAAAYSRAYRQRSKLNSEVLAHQQAAERIRRMRAKQQEVLTPSRRHFPRCNSKEN